MTHDTESACKACTESNPVQEQTASNGTNKCKKGKRQPKKKGWYDYLWIWPIVFFTLGFFNIMFAWLGMIDFLVPLGFAIFAGNKRFCNRYCGRSRLFDLLGSKLKLSRKKPHPKWMSSSPFRYGFLVFFLTMFGMMIYQTYLVAAGAQSLTEAITLLWAFNVPWEWAYTAGALPEFTAQFAFGFYSLMLSSTILGLIAMAAFRPRSWCAFCPMGTMTQGICKLKKKN